MSRRKFLDDDTQQVPSLSFLSRTLSNRVSAWERETAIVFVFAVGLRFFPQTEHKGTREFNYSNQCRIVGVAQQLFLQIL